MNHCDDYFQLSETDNSNIQAIKSKWRFHNNSLHGQPQLKIDFEEQPQKSFQLPDVFLTTRQNQPKVQHHHMTQQSFHEIPKKSRKGSKISLSSLEVSPKIPILNKSKEEKFKELSDLQKSYSQYKKSFHKVKNQQQTQQLNTSAYLQQESSFMFNGVKLPYSLYMINKNRQLAISSIMQNASAQLQEQSKQQIEMIDSQIKQVRNEHQNKQKVREYRSRSFLQNAYYSMLCVNQDSKKRLKRIIQGKFPMESRFQQL
ncbi:unnamed protein product (macronuclear) [Paramecium tetraurelia]|uniref:Uncharacterized protein n=1 Tax=Paramecium tetraurelia TaxID=5888 RepID=A0E365_PARTE|nr:uncharacterized protein GSPATT00022905001 [Paramecium tetraurelia]CAK89732.1 unnamed protein product [Paramecium tetraurelia]|eukprot:XP_001457129.1 hypothetical protein (macronuclear) [Paramecium tetraurelia strain d4-2]